MIYRNGHMQLRRLVNFRIDDNTQNTIFLRLSDNSIILASGVTFDHENKYCYWISGNYHQSQEQVEQFVIDQVDQMRDDALIRVERKLNSVLGWF